MLTSRITLSPEHWAYVPLTLDILRNSSSFVCFVLYSFFFHIGKDVTCCVTCYYVTNILYVVSFYFCKNWVDLDYLGLLHVLCPVFLCLSNWDNIDTEFISFLCSLFKALGQWGGWKQRAASGKDEQDLVKNIGECGFSHFLTRSCSSRARFFDGPHSLRAWNRLFPF